MKILLSANSARDIYKRKKLIQALQNEGYEISTLVIPDETVEQLRKLNVNVFEYKIETRGMNPFNELKLIHYYKKFFHSHKPDVILSFNIKPNIYGGFGAKKNNIPIIFNITGLGQGFEEGSKIKWILKLLYKRSLDYSKAFVFFQNPDDKNYFLTEKIIDENRAGLLPGSGVDLDFYKPTYSKNNDSVNFAFVGRLLISKGVKNFIDASYKIKAEFPNANFFVVGNNAELDKGDSAFLRKADLQKAIDENVITYKGFITDMRQFLDESVDCVVLPSFYREGVPRVLLEGAAMHKPLIGADSPGTKEPIVDGVNGFLCKTATVDELFEKMKKFIMLSSEEKAKMGQESRKIAEKHFSDEIISVKYVQQVNKMLGRYV